MKLNYLSKLVTLLFAISSIHAIAHETNHSHIKHVLIISVDGMHAFDLANFSKSHPHSALAGLIKSGVQYTHAQTVVPADSFPGLLGLVTGGTPAVTGVYYDVSYDRRLSPPASNCHQIGTKVVFDETVDSKLGAANPIDPLLLPLDPSGCTPVYPHAYLKVNTIFEVVRQVGGHTAWIDKHPVYEIVNGPSGHGVEDIYTPEIGANPENENNFHGDKITGSIDRTERYDKNKVEALINEIRGFQHDGKTIAPVPTVFGLNLQSVSVGQKLAGYENASGKPTRQLAGALTYSDNLIGEIVSALRDLKLLDSTLLIVTAKHGNGPVDPQTLRRVDDNAIAQVIEHVAPGEIAQIMPDHGVLIWLHKQNKAPQVAYALMQHNKQLGIKQVLYGATLQKYFPSSVTDARSPDLVIIPQHGVIYAKVGDQKKAEHGGFGANDTHVALLISNPYLQHAGETIKTSVFTTQVAPTTLQSLGMSPDALDAVKKEGTTVLPGENW